MLTNEQRPEGAVAVMDDIAGLIREEDDEARAETDSREPDTDDEE